MYSFNQIFRLGGGILNKLKVRSHQVSLLIGIVINNAKLIDVILICSYFRVLCDIPGICFTLQGSVVKVVAY